MTMDSRPPLLYLVHRIPYPPNKGDKIRSFHIMRQLARRHRVFLGTFVDQPEDLAHVDRLGEWCEDVHAVRLSPGRARLASLRGLLAGEPLSTAYYRVGSLARWVSDTVARHAIRRAVAFSGPMAQYLDEGRFERRVIDFCDVDSEKWAQYAAERRWPLSWLYQREGRRLRDYEREAAAAAESDLFVTETEAALFRRTAPELAARVRVMPNGVDADYFSPRHIFPSPYPDDGPVVVFTGAMDYWPNVDAVTWFAREVLPSLQVRLPSLRFWIVGMNPSATVRGLAGEGVKVTGAVPDVRPYLAHADIVVAPMRVARGIQNKVLEAMAMARPVVLTTASAAGLAAVPGEECELADNPHAWRRRILALLADRQHRTRMGRAARERVLKGYSWDVHLRLLDELLEGPLPAPVPTPAPARVVPLVSGGA